MTAATPPATRVVLDTNVWLALWIFTDPTVDALRAALAAGELLPVRSAATDAELREVLARPALFDVPPARQAELLAAWAASAELVADPPPVALHCRDPLDQKFVELAVASGARWLVTRDKALLKLRKRAARLGLTITPPAGFVAVAADLAER